MRLAVSPQTNTGQLGHFTKNQLKFNKPTPPAANNAQLSLVLLIRRDVTASPAPVGCRHS